MTLVSVSLTKLFPELIFIALWVSPKSMLFFFDTAKASPIHSKFNEAKSLVITFKISSLPTFH